MAERHRRAIVVGDELQLPDTGAPCRHNRRPNDPRAGSFVPAGVRRAGQRASFRATSSMIAS
jgi:hypothetical protein